MGLASVALEKLGDVEYIHISISVRLNVVKKYSLEIMHTGVYICVCHKPTVKTLEHSSKHVQRYQ